MYILPDRVTSTMDLSNMACGARPPTYPRHAAIPPMFHRHRVELLTHVPLSRAYSSSEPEERAASVTANGGMFSRMS